MNKIIFISIILILVVTFASAQCIPTRIHVDAAATGSNDGSTWTDAFLDLQDAITMACANTEIWVANGTYNPSVSVDVDNNGTAEVREATYYFDQDVQLYGGFNGTETGLSERDLVCGETMTILSGDIGSLNDNAYHVVFLNMVSSAFVFDGFIVRDGNTNTVSGTVNSRGGGLYNNGTGAGNSSNPVINNCIFRNNTARVGGAIYNGGLFQGQANPLISNTSFINNAASLSGGAIYNGGDNNGDSSPTITNVSFVNNFSGLGGGVYNSGSSGNSNPTFENVYFLNNSTPLVGGAIVNDGRTNGNCSPIFTNVNFVNNSSNSGGAVFNNGANGGSCKPIFINNIFWGNTANISGAIFQNDAAQPNISHSLVDAIDCNAIINDTAIGTTCGTGMKFNQDPLFIDVANVNLRLSCTSPGIDMGTNTNAPIADIEGIPIQNGTRDMGAFEGCEGIVGCTDPTASNYSAVAACDDGSCMQICEPAVPVILSNGPTQRN